MSLIIEVFRSDDYIPDGEIPLLPVLRGVFAEVIGPDAKGARYQLRFYELTDLTPDRGKPSLVNLRASHGFVRVRIWRDDQLLYQHPHPIRELIGEPLRELLRDRDPSVTHWGYGLRGPGLERIGLTRPAPQVTHEVRVATGERRPSIFSVEELPDPDPPQTTLAALGAVEGAGFRAPPGGDDKAPPVVIAVPDSLVTAFVQTLPFSGEIEEGGFLAGKVYRDEDRPGGYLIHVTAVIPAERTGASMINFTFTGESFLRVSPALTSRANGETLLGWYHTHLFPATSRTGLSSVDMELHRSTFRRPWQVAGLVNISGDGRVLRFYHGAGEQMARVPYWTVPS